ncbi:MAG: lipopolysaccharide biosynthesi [Gallionellaceae bacterium]|nr:MAG: lipopolysaccharide biosynthesi [Gallionellaceae bacterium]
MSFQQFLSILWARKKIALAVLGSVVAITLVGSLLMPKIYKATTNLVLNYKGADPVTGMAIPAQLMPGYMPTQVEIISSQRVALKVVDTLGFDRSPVVQQQFREATDGEGDIRNWLAGSLLKSLDVQPSRESSIITIGYEGNDPKFVAMLANAFAEAYIQTTLQLKVEPSRQAAAWFDGQVKALREDLNKAQARLSAYQQETGIISVDERMDVESARLAELSSQVIAAQYQTYDMASRQQQISSSKRLDENPDIMNNPLIVNMKAELSRAESKFAELGQRLDKNHPQYLATKAELENLRLKLQAELQLASSSMGSAKNISQQRESELRGALAKQKARVLQLKQQRDQIAILQRDVESAQRALDLGMQRLSQTNMEGQANQTDVAILNPAIAPLKPGKPRVMLNALVAVFAGTILAVALALLVEMLDRRVRAPEDLAFGLELPVLGVLGKPQPKSKPWSLSLIWRKPALA